MKKILVIDDETITIQIIRFTLEENANLEVITAADGSKAIEYLENNVPDLIISDLVMPFKTGVDVVSYVNEKYPQLPIIVMSSLASNHKNVLEVKKLNISFYIAKPLDSEVLNNCVIELLAKDEVEIVNPNANKKELNSELNSTSDFEKSKNINDETEKSIKPEENSMDKNKNKETELETIKETSSKIQTTEIDLVDSKKHDEKVKKVKTKIKENKKEGKKILKKLKSNLFKEEFDKNNIKKIVKKLQKITALHFGFINELEKLEE